MRKKLLFAVTALLTGFAFAEKVSVDEKQIRLEYALDITDYTGRVRSMTKKTIPAVNRLANPAGSFLELTREEAFSQYKKIADSDSSNLIAQCAVAYCYMEGYGTEKSPEKGKSYFKKAAEKNFAPALNSLGSFWEDEDGFINFYERAAAQNYVNALYNLSTCYAEGKGCEKSLEKAEKCLLKIRDLHLDDENIYLYIAGFHKEELGESDEVCLPYFIEAAERGNDTAMFDLWFNYFVKYKDGDDAENAANRAKWYRRYHEQRAKNFFERVENENETFPYYLRRAQKGELYAIKKVIDYYGDFSGFHKNLLKAFEWKIKAADSGDVESCFSVAETLAKGSLLQRDYKKALFYFNKGMSLAGSEKNNTAIRTLKEIAFIRLSVYGFVNRYNKSREKMPQIYTHFYGENADFVSKNDAISFLEKYAARDRDCALGLAYYKYLNESEKSALGILKLYSLEDASEYLDYSNDENDPNSKEEKAKRSMWIRKADAEIKELEDKLKEDPSDGKTFFDLAKIYDNSDIAANIKKAYEYFSKSAELLYPESFYYLSGYYKMGKLFDSDIKKECELLEKGCQYGDAMSMFALAEKWRDGTYFDQKKNVFVQDFDKAIELLKKSYELNPKSFLAKSELEYFNVKSSSEDDDEFAWFYKNNKKKEKTFDWESWVFADYDFNDDADIPDYKEDEGYWKNTEIIECTLEEGKNSFKKRIDSLRGGKAYRLVFSEKLNDKKFLELYKYFSESDHASRLTLDLDLRRCEATWMPSHSLCGKFRNIYLPDNTIYYSDSSLDVYAEKIVFGSCVTNFTDPVNSREIGLMDFSLVTEEKFSPQLAYSISQLKVNYMRSVPVKSVFEFITIEERHSLSVMKTLRNTLESNPGKKFIVDLTHSVYATDPSSGIKVPFPKNFLAKQENLYYLVLGDCEGIEFPENMCRDCRNLQSVIMWNYDPLSEKAFLGVNRNCTVWKFGHPETLLREIF